MTKHCSAGSCRESEPAAVIVSFQKQLSPGASTKVNVPNDSFMRASAQKSVTPYSEAFLIFLVSPRSIFISCRFDERSFCLAVSATQGLFFAARQCCVSPHHYLVVRRCHFERFLHQAVLAKHRSCLSSTEHSKSRRPG